MQHKTKFFVFVLSSSIICSSLLLGPIQAKTKAETSKDIAKMAITETDKNGDRKISLEEAKAMPNMHKNFAVLDLNEDGFLSQKEMAKTIAKKLEGAPSSITKGKEKKKIKKPKRDSFPKRMSKNLIERKDKNGDKKLSKKELSSRKSLLKKFRSLDTNRDRLLSQSELEPYYNW